MSEVVVKGESEPIDSRIIGVLDNSFNPAKEEVTEEPEKETPAEPEEEEEEEPTPEVNNINEGDDEDEPSEKKPSRAEKRIRQLNDDKKAAEDKAHTLELQMAEMKPYLEMLKQQATPKVEEQSILPQDYETQEDLAQAILARAEENVMAKLEAKLAPLQHTQTNSQYLASINSWFATHPEATEVKGQMDKLSEGIDADTRGMYEKQILSGNTFILDALYSMAKPEKADNSGLITKSMKDDQEKASIGSAKKSTKSTKVINSNSSWDKAKAGDPTDYARDWFMAMEKKL